MVGSFIDFKNGFLSFCSAPVPSPVLTLKVRTQKSTRKIRLADSPAACDGHTDYSWWQKTHYAGNVEILNFNSRYKGLG